MSWSVNSKWSQENKARGREMPTEMPEIVLP